MILEIRVSVKNNKRQEFLQMFELLSSTTHLINGRIEQRLFEEVGKPDHFLWKEQWIDAKSLEKYFRSDSFRSLLGAILVLGKLGEIRMGELSPIRDIDDK